MLNASQILKSGELQKAASQSKNTRLLAWMPLPVQLSLEKILLTLPSHQLEPPPNILDTVPAALASYVFSHQVERGGISQPVRATCA